MTTEDERIVAALHDIVEDTDVTLDQLRTEGFAQHIVLAVGLLTRRPPWSYAEYIDTLAESPLAVAVKVGDLQDHLDPSLPRPADYASLKPRYEKALEKLRRSPASNEGIQKRMVLCGNCAKSYDANVAGSENQHGAGKCLHDREFVGPTY